jgi:DNA-binding SARP family transcriptional activator
MTLARDAVEGAPARVPTTDALSLLRRRSSLSMELLPGWYDDWVIFERDRLRQLRLHALEALTEELIVQGLYARAIETALETIRLEPLRESAHRLAMRIHLEENNVVEAMRHYRAFRDLLREELGIEPSADLQMLLPPSVLDRLHGVPRG